MKRVALGMLSVLLVLAFAACGGQNSGEQEADWVAAFDEGNFAKYKVAFTFLYNADTEANGTMTVSVDGKKFLAVKDSNEMYMSEENGKLYQYNKGPGGGWSKEDVTETGSLAYSRYNNLTFFKDAKDGESDFTQTDGWYVCEKNKVMKYARELLDAREVEGMDPDVFDLKLKLRDNKLAEVILEMEGLLKITLTFSDYDKVTVTLPAA